MMEDLITKKEIAYQHVHFFYSALICYIFYRFRFKFFYLTGFLFGVIMEIIQYMFFDTSLRLADRIMDVCSWGLGSLMFFLYIEWEIKNGHKRIY